MVRKTFLFPVILSALVLVCFGASVSAAGPLVVDQAGTFTSEELANLEAEARQLGEQYDMDIVIVTTDDAGGKSAREYADDFFDYNGYGVGDDRDGILFLIDFDNREAYISTSGLGIRYLTDARIESILDDIFDAGMADGNYFGASQAFLDSTANFLAAGIPSDQYNEPEKDNKLTAAESIVGAILSGTLGIGVFAGTKRSYKGKKQRSIFNYRSNSLVNLGVIGDVLTKSYITSRIIPRNTTSSGGSSFGGRSSTHTSSSGRTHGGGGRRF